MPLTSLSFFIFFFIVFLACLALQKNNEQKKSLLLVISYYFYMTLDWRFSILLLALTLINYFAGMIISNSNKESTRRISVMIAVSLSLLILFYFKYFNFFIESFTELFTFGTSERETPIISVILPIGISFMTFQAITYPLDLYHKKLTHQASLKDFSLFMSFFPQLLSGPIVRASYFMPQLESNSGFNTKNTIEGLALIMRGLIKKILIADILALHIVDPAFAAPGAFSSAFLVIAIVAFSFQVYMDLSGYTDIALGVGRTLGYKLPINFNRPYLATSIANYWQRWHISMSSFFREYLYEAISSWTWCNIYAKLLIVFMAIGLWHGAGWNFILYGLIHGSLVGLEQYQKSRMAEKNRPLKVYRGLNLLVRVLQIFAIVSFTRILFRGEDLQASLNFIDAIMFNSSTEFPLSFIAGCALSSAILLHFTVSDTQEKLTKLLHFLPSFVSGAVIATVIYVLTAIGSDNVGFIYFQF
jgi:alginate O-acetyltransferase complex protein AlgI